VGHQVQIGRERERRAVRVARHAVAEGDGQLRGQVGQARLAVEGLAVVDNADGALDAVVVRRQGAQHARRTGDRPSLDERGRIERAVAVEHPQVGAIGLDGPQTLDRDGWPVHVFPPRIEDPPVGHDRWGEVVHVVRRQHADARTISFHTMERGDGRHIAEHEPLRPSRHEGDAAIGQPARVEVVVGAIGELGQPRAIGAAAEQMVGLARLLPREHDLASVER